MSFSDAIGQIDQIVQWEQQLADPAAATQTTSSGGTAATSDTSGTSGTSAGDAAGSTSFSDALAQAQGQGGSTSAGLLDPSSASTGGTSDLLSGGDSQLLAALSSASGSDTAGTNGTGGTGGTASSSSTLSALESALSSTGTSDSGSSSSVLTALESELQNGSATGASPLTGVSGATYTTATSPSDPRIASMVQEADSLVGKPYVWGGGHSGWGQQSGYDCSGFVSAVLHSAGYLSSPADTTSLPSQAGIEQGPGQYVTIYDRDKPGQEGHVIIQIDGQFYESGGEQGSWGGGGGVAKISTPSASYLASFNQVLHPAGL